MEFNELLPISAISEERRITFFRKTYAHLAIAVLLFAMVEYVFFQVPSILEFAMSMTQGWRWMMLLVGFMFITNYAENTALKSHNRNEQYGALLLYVIAEAFIFIPLIGMAMLITAESGQNILYQAAIITLSLFTGISAVALLSKKDFSFMRSILSIGFFVGLGMMIAGMIFGFNLGLWFSVGMAVLAAGSILYQTSNMVHRYSEDQYVGASLGLFASLMLLFWYILNILSRD